MLAGNFPFEPFATTSQPRTIHTLLHPTIRAASPPEWTTRTCSNTRQPSRDHIPLLHQTPTRLSRTMAGSPTSSGSKRSHSDSANDSQQPKKRVKVTRRLHHVQTRPQHVELAPQDPVFVQGQLMRSISAALTMVGFDSVKPTALEMFRSHVEECEDILLYGEVIQALTDNKTCSTSSTTPEPPCPPTAARNRQQPTSPPL